ncbi:MAG: sigma-70 family RNA polymerase sigma factor [Pirellulales bacterium]
MNPTSNDVLALLSEHGRRLHALLYRLTLDYDVADDLMQDLFVNLSQRSGFLSAIDPLGYALRSATHLAFDWRRKQSRMPVTQELSKDIAAANVDHQIAILKQEQMQHLLSLLDETEHRDRTILVLRYLEGHSHQQIAAIIGKTAHQTRALCFKALMRLRRRLDAPAPVEADPRESAS